LNSQQSLVGFKFDDTISNLEIPETTSFGIKPAVALQWIRETGVLNSISQMKLNVNGS